MIRAALPFLRRVAAWFGLVVQRREDHRRFLRHVMGLYDALQRAQEERDQLSGVLRGIVGDHVEEGRCRSCGVHVDVGCEARCPVHRAIVTLARQTESEVRA